MIKTLSHTKKSLFVVFIFVLGQAMVSPVLNLFPSDTLDPLFDQLINISVDLAMILVSVPLFIAFGIKKGLLENPFRASTGYKMLFFILLIIAFVANTHFVNELLFYMIFLGIIVSAILEEIYFRGLLFNLIKQKKDVLISVLISSSIFGLLHLINLISQPENIIGILLQCYYATIFGVIFCYCLAKTRNVLFVGLFHAAFNLFLNQSAFEKDETNFVVESYSYDLISTSILFLSMSIVGVYFIYKIRNIDSLTSSSNLKNIT